VVRTIVQLTESQSQALRRQSQDQGVSLAELVRRSVDLFLRQEPAMDEVRRRAISAVGYARSGDTDVSIRHDDYLAEAHNP